MNTDDVGSDCSVAFQTVPSYELQLPRNPVLESLRPLLGKQCAFYPTLATVAGSIKAGILLSQLWYWTTRQAESPAGKCWIWKTSEQWQAETGLTLREQANVRERLCSMGLIEIRRLGVPARLHYRLLLDPLASRLHSQADTDGDNPATPRTENIAVLLGKSQPHFRILTTLTGSLHAGLLLSRALQGIRFAKRSDEAAGRLRLSQRTGEALGLTRREWERARRHLVACGIWTERLAGVPARLETCVNLKQLQALLGPLMDKGDASPVGGDTAIRAAQSVQTSMWPDRNLVMRKAPNKLCANRRTSSTESADLYKTRITDHSVLPPTAPASESRKPDSGERLIFPSGLLPDERKAAERLLLECGSDAQVLLDELAGRLQAKGVRHSAIGYLRALVQRWRAGGFIPERAQQVAAARERQQAANRARNHARLEVERMQVVDDSPEGRLRRQARRADIAQLRETLKRRIPKAEPS